VIASNGSSFNGNRITMPTIDFDILLLTTVLLKKKRERERENVCKIEVALL
jgi:hypothetical protein